MGKKLDLLGKRFGRLTVIAEAEKDPKRGFCWLCACDCGAKKIFKGIDLRADDAKSCGCFKIDTLFERNTVHGGTGTREYETWKNMKKRCYAENGEDWPLYGGRGIKVCDRWKDSFENFLSDMGPRPRGTSIDRIDSNKDYSPDNCRWATNREQTRNTSRNIFVNVDGERMILKDACAKLGLSYSAIVLRISKGMNPDNALSKPIRKMKRKSEWK